MPTSMGRPDWASSREHVNEHGTGGSPDWDLRRRQSACSGCATARPRRNGPVQAPRVCGATIERSAPAAKARYVPTVPEAPSQNPLRRYTVRGLLGRGRFELELEPGGASILTGANGTGKST